MFGSNIKLLYLNYISSITCLTTFYTAALRLWNYNFDFCDRAKYHFIREKNDHQYEHSVLLVLCTRKLAFVQLNMSLFQGSLLALVHCSLVNKLKED